MKWKTFVIGYALALALLLFAQHRPERAQAQPASFSHIIDLTHSIGSGRTANAPVRQQISPQPKPIAAIMRDGAGRSAAAQPFPTRLDAPGLLAPGLWAVDQIPPERLFAPLVVIDIRKQARSNSDYQLSVADIANWEQTHGQIPQGALVMACTGWAQRWSAPREYRNRDRHGVAHSPGFSLQAAQFLVQGRNVVGLGIDSASPDAGDETDSPVRAYALSHSVYQIENVANLWQAPESGGLVLVAPAKLQGSSSAPVRVMALAR
ncbi:MAG TPA: cyclase family protein [Terriglobales bacterium]|nr:cyclase family protein [Terriglobales bacterium]